MANIFQKIFLSKYRWHALDTINRYDISYEHKHWVTIGEQNPMRQYNNSAHQLTAESNKTRVVAIREYSEQREFPETPNNFPEYPYKYELYVYRKDKKSPHPKVDSEVDTLFAGRMYHKMLNKYNWTKER